MQREIRTALNRIHLNGLRERLDPALDISMQNAP